MIAIIPLRTAASARCTLLPRGAVRHLSSASSSAATTTALVSPTAKNNERREMHSTAHSDDVAISAPTAMMADAVPPQEKEEVAKKTSSSSSSLMDRFVVTAEVTVSKIFPAGFGWQTASLMAEKAGYSPESLNFALSTGAGDAVGVVAGHMAYYTAKKKFLGDDKGDDINLTQELHTGILLGSAAFCSGTVWQPIVNTLQGADLPFQQVFAGTWLGCGLAFYAGLRVGRTVLSGPLKYVEEPTYDNSKNDLALSSAIGGATGFFVGTDASYLPDQNFLIDIVGIHDDIPNLAGCAIAGTSTSLGFLTSQSAMNLVYPQGKCWND